MSSRFGLGLWLAARSAGNNFPKQSFLTNANSPWNNHKACFHRKSRLQGFAAAATCSCGEAELLGFKIPAAGDLMGWLAGPKLEGRAVD